jgi:hypothetical protein
MGTKQKEKREVLMTPVGIAVYPYLNKPQPAHETATDKTPSWKVGIKLKRGDPAVDAFIADLQRRYDENLAEAEANETPKDRAKRLASKNPELGADLPWKDDFDETGQNTGFVIINLKQKCSAIRKSDGEKFDFFVDLFDAKGKRIDRNTVKIGGGSTICCAFEVGTFATGIGAGLSLRLKAVQVLERVEYQGRDATGYGFKPQDGFEVDAVRTMDVEDVEDAAAGDQDDGSI